MNFKRKTHQLLLVLLTVIVLVGNLYATAIFPESHKREFSEEQLKEYRDDPDFFYLKMEEKSDDFWDVWRYYLSKMLDGIFSSNASRQIADNFEYIIIAIVLIVIFLNRKHFKFEKLKVKSKKSPEMALSFDEENIEDVNFEELMRVALENRDYKNAIRYSFLDVLKKLNNAKKIKWEPYKTNYEYLHELRSKELREHFRFAVLVFDYIWYGNNELEEKEYISALEELKIIKKDLPEE